MCSVVRVHIVAFDRTVEKNALFNLCQFMVSELIISLLFARFSASPVTKHTYVSYISAQLLSCPFVQ
ncbi:hypothetical protein Tsp_10417 [Trichinella spiralis]|uniref:hypothetical protein n=1 Tax=Trichinella spiralis TaxID=6334 RepID=UPI0001EFEC5C|nr:hypothetical protein Tsp_10417 [Trichinella spiralis]